MKKQGLDMLATEAGNHLLGHLLLKQGGFTLDQQQRIRVLTDGSIDFRKIELAIRKIFGDSLGEAQSKTYWGEAWDEDACDEVGEYDSYFGGEARDQDGTSFGEDTFFDDLLDFDPDSGEVYMIVDDLPQDSLEETEAIEYAGEYLSWVFFEARDRAKGKGKGKGGKHGKSKSFGKGKGHKGGFGKRPPPPGTFGVYGSYLDHRRALQDARKGRGFDRQHDQRQRLSLEQLQAKSRCHACRQVGHWSRNCPLKGRQRETSRPPTTVNQSSGHRPTAAMFFVEPPATSSGFLSMSADSPTREQYTSESLQDMSSHTVCSYLCFSSPSQPPSPIETWELLSYNFATATETPGRALVDTAAQRGLIG